MQNINKKQEYLCFASVSSYIGVWAKPTLMTRGMDSCYIETYRKAEGGYNKSAYLKTLWFFNAQTLS